MSISAKAATKFRRAYIPNSALAKSVQFDNEMMYVHLTDGRIIGVPIRWFPLLREATPSQRARHEIGGTSIHWEEIDEDLSIAGLMSGVDWDAA